MSRYIDGEWLLRFFEPYHDGYHTPLGILRACVDDAPSIDIVRCKECAKRMREDCPMCNGCKLDRVPTEDDDFCSYGEREGE